METIFRGQHVHIDDPFREHANERLAKIGRHLPAADHAIVDVRREAKGDEGRYVVQLTVNCTTYLPSSPFASRRTSTIAWSAVGR